MNKRVIEIRNNKLDSDAIVKDILKKVEQRNIQKEKLPTLNDIFLKELQIEEYDQERLFITLRKINSFYQINSEREIQGNIIVKFIKIVIRKFVRWYVAPIIEEQNRFNELAVEALKDFYSSTFYLYENKMKLLEEKIIFLESKLPNKID